MRWDERLFHRASSEKYRKRGIEGPLAVWNSHLVVNSV